MERPAINRIAVTGNAIIETEPLLEGLKRSGLVEGDIFKQSSLETIERELNAQYSSIGRYATQVQTRVIRLKQNQVNIAIKILNFIIIIKIFNHRNPIFLSFSNIIKFRFYFCCKTKI